MTELKKLSYKLEDTFALGRSLPVVAMRQLPKLADAFEALPQEPGYVEGVPLAMASHIRGFVSRNSRLIDDERQLTAIFTDACRRAVYGPRYLALLAL
ncbi:MAG: hypothetical protein IJV08_11490 [Bacteroidaceae bacterium]|nr:hypothetical protein [Bacteroidaceae bacterium]MBR1449520.1 hypothetical protein [Prevotella sp.]